MLFDPAGVVWYRGAYVFSTKISQLRRSIIKYVNPVGIKILVFSLRSK